VLLWLGDDRDADFDDNFRFSMLSVDAKALLLLGVVLLLLLGDNTDAGADEWCFRRLEISDKALLLLLLMEEDTDGDRRKRTSLGISALVSDDCLSLVFIAAELGLPSTLIRHSGGNTSLANVHIKNIISTVKFVS